MEILSLPCFLSEAELLKNYLKSLTFEEVRELWACSEATAGLNRQRLWTWT